MPVPEERPTGQKNRVPLRSKHIDIAEPWKTIETKLCYIWDLCQLETGELLVVGRTDDNRHGVLLYENYEEKQNDFFYHEYQLPSLISGVCVDHDDGTIYITEYSAVGKPGILHMHKRNKDTWSHNKTEVCEMPRSVALTKDKHIIIGDFEGKLYKYNTEINQIWEKDLKSQWPVYVLVNKDDDILIAHVPDKGICMLNAEHPGDQECDDMFRTLLPACVALDVNGDILIAAMNSNNLCLFDKKTMMELKQLQLKNNPTQVKIENDKLIMAEGKNVLIYKV